ncbi:Stk1 family PASTA domain-containing Ser/Thr kinase [Agrilactobacillus yilanensis]|uniref:non-specific serine/threonine protein kinase n=1 Tax=Agrilactobacillus yilanensis TaxID=2485997 RepID=A0ABW4J8W6_9LACO|nr:Stk1 family PASTA domain-containing Ser/Thr kinase [Agrilactobacillus yilanensis]
MMEPGYLLNGRYKVSKPIGEGGMANVYLADDQQTGQQVAVKVLRLDLQNNLNTKKRFQREARASRKLNHPNIIKVFDIGEENGMNYIVMEYIVGMDLKQYIQKNFPIPYQKVIDIMEQILSAVQVAHDHDIIHRDLKPQNIMIDNHDHIKIADFGIAVALHDNSLTQTNTLLGSVHYLSPEQAKGGMATKRSDIYALGIILYELLTSKVPFEGESAVSIAIKHFQSEIPSVQKADPRIPQALENVVLHATAKDPMDRYASALEMRTDLATSLDKKRLNEPKFVPTTPNLDETKVITIPETELVQAAADEQTQTMATKTVAPEQKKAAKPFYKKRRFWIYGGIVALIIILTVGIVSGSLKKNVSIPDLSGMTLSQAKTALNTNQLTMGDISKQHSDSVQKNRVIRTYPKEGMVVKESSKVGLLVSLGPKKVDVGNYVGQNYKTVKKKLEKLGFTVRKNAVTSGKYSKGTIVKQDIPEGKAVVPANSIITLTVSTGEAVFKLRDLTSYTQKSVQDYANENGLTLNLSYEYSDDVEKGLVISQNPAAGTAVSKGSTLNIVLSLGEKTTKPETVTFSKTITIPFSAAAVSSSSSSSHSTSSASSDSSSTSSSTSSTSSAQENYVTIFVKDADHSIDDVYKQLVITKDTSVTLSFTVKTSDETAYYRVVRDGEVIVSDEVQPDN